MAEYTIITFPTDSSYFQSRVDLPALGSFLFTCKWNTQDLSWYVDISDSNGNPIAYSLHVVLGAMMGRRVRHTMFQRGLLMPLDTSNSGVEAGIGDFGTRVVLLYLTDEDYLQSLRDAGISV